MNRFALFAAAALAAGLQPACSCSNTCALDEPDCLLDGLVLEQEGKKLELLSVSADTLQRHYPSRTRATDLWAVGEEGAILHFDGAEWSAAASGVTARLKAVWGPAPAALWAVGEGGTVVHWDAAAWGPAVSGVTSDLNAVHGSSAVDVWAVGAGGIILHWDGASWSLVPSGATESLTGVFAAAPGDAWAVGGAGLVLRWDGKAWSRQVTPFPPGGPVSAVWGTGASDVWAAGRGGWAMHFDGASWTPSLDSSGAWLQSLGGSGSSDVWAVADAGQAVLRWGGTGWTEVPMANLSALHAVWAAAPNDAFTVGKTVGHWDGRVWRSVGVPENPGLNGVIGFAPAPDGGSTSGSTLTAWRTGADAALTVIGTEARREFELGFNDPAGCTPSFCFSVCSGGRSNCSAAFSCTRAQRDGRYSGTWRSSLGFSVEPADESLTFDVSVAVLSDPTCAENPAALEPEVVLAGAGPDLPIQLEAEPDEDEGGGGGDCSNYKAVCGTTQSGIESVGSWYPKKCACPGGMIDQGGSHDNQLCGLPGAGYDCKYCACR